MNTNYLDQTFIPPNDSIYVKMDPKLEKIVTPMKVFKDGSYSTRFHITKCLIKYVKDNKLNKGIMIHFDPTLKEILGDNDPINMLCLQELLPHLIKAPYYDGQCHTCNKTNFKFPIKQGGFYYCSKECFFSV